MHASMENSQSHADNLRSVAQRWWQSRELSAVTLEDVPEPAHDADYTVACQMVFRARADKCLSLTSFITDEGSVGLGLSWRSHIRFAAGFEPVNLDLSKLALVLDHVSAGRFLIDEPNPILRLVGIYPMAVVQRAEAGSLQGWGPKGWIKSTDQVLPWRRAALTQTAPWS